MTDSASCVSFSIIGCIIRVSIESAYLRAILLKMYGNMQLPDNDNVAAIEYEIKLLDSEVFQVSISRSGCADLNAYDIGEFIFLFEKDMTIEVQKLRPDLLFIHSAALAYQGRGLLLVAPSGTGKSTTSWVMLNCGFNYLSDELAPLDLNAMRIVPYPHALCLKAEPPVYPLPQSSLMTTRTIHVPINIEKKHADLASVSLDYVFYLEFDENIIEPVITQITTAQASAKLYANSLNILAHEQGEKGIQAAISVARRVNNYILKSNDLNKTCKQVQLLIDTD